MIIRPQYMNALKTYRDVPLVKILAGIRRCGKSTILDMLRDDLQKSGIAADHILSMRYTSEDFDDGMTDKEMYSGIKNQMVDDGRYYLLLDEVQEIDGWEKAVNSLLENANTDIYVTGSNSKLMSSEISTYLTGRYISIPVYTLSFSEYLDFKQNDSRSPRELLNEYLRFGGFPIVALGHFDERSAYLRGRGIDQEVIDYCVQTGRIYESRNKGHGNVVFVGFDKEGKARFGCLHGIGQARFHGDLSGSDKHFSFALPACVENPAVHLCECAIDVMS